MTGILLTLGAALAAGPTLLQLDPATPQLASYRAVHKLHEFTGTSHDLKGVARLLPDGTVQVQIRGPVGGFDSGNGNRDEHMKETVEAIKFPEVVVKCLTKVTPGAAGPQQPNADCEITLHGKPEKVSTPLTVTFDSPSHAHVAGTFSVSWDGFGIQRPQLLFVPIDDKGVVTVDLHFVAGS